MQYTCTCVVIIHPSIRSFSFYKSFSSSMHTHYYIIPLPRRAVRASLPHDARAELRGPRGGVRGAARAARKRALREPSSSAAGPVAARLAGQSAQPRAHFIRLLADVRWSWRWCWYWHLVKISLPFFPKTMVVVVGFQSEAVVLI